MIKENNLRRWSRRFCGRRSGAGAMAPKAFGAGLFKGRLSWPRIIENFLFIPTFNSGLALTCFRTTRPGFGGAGWAMICFKRLSDAGKSCNTKNRTNWNLDLWKEGEVGQAGRIKGLLKTSRDLKGQMNLDKPKTLDSKKWRNARRYLSVSGFLVSSKRNALTVINIR